MLEQILEGAKTLFAFIGHEKVRNVSQVFFYVSISSLTYFAYRQAQKGLLSPVNTEYQKLVIQRLKEVSEELIEEFDRDSPNRWAKRVGIPREITQIQEMFRSDWEVTSGVFMVGSTGPLPPAEDAQYFKNYAERIRSDPFIPKELRKDIHDFYESRSDSIQETKKRVYDEYVQELKKGTMGEDMQSDTLLVHNKVFDGLKEKGFGYMQVKKSVHDLRTQIQEYLESHAPF